jgi:hypothetical protein
MMPDMTTDHYRLIIREAYKQGYLNCRADIEGSASDIEMDESLFDDWLSEISTDGYVGDMPIFEED